MGYVLLTLLSMTMEVNKTRIMIYTGMSTVGKVNEK
jgi:hypothetical protein